MVGTARILESLNRGYTALQGEKEFKARMCAHVRAKFVTSIVIYQPQDVTHVLVHPETHRHKSKHNHTNTHTPTQCQQRQEYEKHLRKTLDSDQGAGTSSWQHQVGPASPAGSWDAGRNSVALQ